VTVVGDRGSDGPALKAEAPDKAQANAAVTAVALNNGYFSQVP